MERLRILFLAADPGSMGQVNAAREAREIRERLRAAEHRDAIELVERFSVRPGDLQQAFFEVRPHVVHFCGHGTADEGLVFVGDDGGAEPLGKRALGDLFRVHKDTIRVVVLSACHSRPQVEAIAEHVECAIGMRRAIGSLAATEFSAAFYLAVGFGASVAMAFESGIAELRARGIPEDSTPQLVVRAGTDATRVILLGSPATAPDPGEIQLPGSAGEARVAGAPPGRDGIVAATGEHRVCTVTFVDLGDARRLVSHLDPEDAKDVIDRGFAAVREQVEAMGGVLEELSGSDRAMALFGVPRAADDDAERAVLSALRAQAAIGRVALPRALRRSRLSARIGVSTGRVFVELESATRARLTALGEAVDTASTLQQTAPAGAVVIGRDTYRLIVGLFTLEPLAPVGALPVYRVVGAVPMRPVMAIADFYGVDTSLVGRAAELLRLTDALETMLVERRAGLVTLIGASGIGRSRLLAELYASLSLHREELLVMVAQGSPLLGSTSYGLAAAMLRRRFAILDNDEAPVVRRKLRRGLRWLRMRFARRSGGAEAAALGRADLDDALDQIAGLLGAGNNGGAEPGSMALGDGDGAQKQRISAAAARLLRLASGTAPIVILCDKLQWADAASLDLLDDLLLRAEDLPVLAVCAARPELLERRPGWGRDKASHTRVDLAPLARRHVEEMIRDHLRRVPDLSPSVVRTLADRAEGHPLILIETLHLLVDAGVIEVHGDEPWALHEEKLGALALPATVQGIVQARLDRLEAAPRAVLAQAAVVGRTFWAGAVEQMQEADRPGTPAALPAGVLSRLRDRQLIRPREPAMFPGEREYVFSESAMYEVAYETLSVKVRRPLHLVVARWLEARAAGGAGTALVALHYDRGGDPVRAAAAYVRAAGHAVSLGENAEARGLLERARDIDDEALENASAAGTGEDRQGVFSWQDAVRLRLDLGDVLRRLGQLDEAERTLEEARARLPRRSDANDALRFEARVDHSLALVHRVRGETKEAIALVERAIGRAREAGVIEETLAMYALLAVLCRRERQLDASIEAALAGLRVSRTRPRDERRRGDVAQLLCGLGNALYARGRIVGAERSYHQALRAIDEAKHPHVSGLALNGIAAARLARGELRGVREMFVRSLRLKERVGDLHQIAIACNNLAEVELRLGDVPAALELARRSVRLGEQVSAGYDLADFLRNLSEALLASGDVEAALDAGRKALAIAETIGRVYLGDVAVSLARVCARAVEAPGAEALRARAVEAAELLGRSLSVHFVDDDLRRRADECRALLARVLLDNSRVPRAPEGGG